MDDETPEVEHQDPIQILQNAVSLIADEGSLSVGFVLACEWLDADGSASLQVFHTPMSPWHLSGLLEYARESQCGPLVQVVDADWDDDDF